MNTIYTFVLTKVNIAYSKNRISLFAKLLNYSLCKKFKDGTNSSLTKYPKVGYGCG